MASIIAGLVTKLFNFRRLEPIVGQIMTKSRQSVCGGVSDVRWRVKPDTGKQDRCTHIKWNLRAKQLRPTLVEADSVEFDGDRAVTNQPKCEFEVRERLPLRA